jgi:hypothetical protein
MTENDENKEIITKNTQLKAEPKHEVSVSAALTQFEKFMTKNEPAPPASRQQMKGLLDQWKRHCEEKLHAEVLLDETRSKILALMDADKMDVDNFHLVKVRNYGGYPERDKNIKNNTFTWILQIREKEKP